MKWSATIVFGLTAGLFLAAPAVTAQTNKPLYWKYKPSGQVEYRYSKLNFDDNAATSPTVYLQNLPDSQVDTGNHEIVFNQDNEFLFGKAAKYGGGKRLRINGAGWYNQNNASRYRGKLLDASFSLPSSDETHRITLGKQHVTWSQDTNFHPIDIVGRYQQPKNAIGLNERNPFFKEGRTGIRYQFIGDTNSFDAIVAEAKGNQIHDGEYQIAVNWGQSFDDAEISWIAEYTKDFSPRYGFSFSSNMGKDWVFYSEFIASGDREIPLAADLAPANEVSESLTLPAINHFQLRSDKDFYAKGLVSLRIPAFQGGIAEVSLYYNSHGYNTEEWQDLQSRLLTSESTFTQPQFVDAFSTGNPHITFLSDTSLLMQDFYLRRAYLGLRFDTWEMFDFGALEIDAVVNLEDDSGSVQFTFRKNLTQTLAIKTYAVVVHKPGNSEEAESPIHSEIRMSLIANF